MKATGNIFSSMFSFKKGILEVRQQRDLQGTMGHVGIDRKTLKKQKKSSLVLYKEYYKVVVLRFLKKFIEGQLIYNAALISAVQQK